MKKDIQLLMNRKQPAKLTGPKTLEGKARSSRNSLKHGILSKELIIRDEIEGEFNNLRDSLFKSLNPQGATEELLVEKMVLSAWRMKRLVKVEASALTKKNFQFSLSSGYKDLSDCFSGRSMNVISRYESNIERGFYKAFHELQRLQGIRMGQSVPLPRVCCITL